MSANLKDIKMAKVSNEILIQKRVMIKEKSIIYASEEKFLNYVL